MNSKAILAVSASVDLRGALYDVVFVPRRSFCLLELATLVGLAAYFALTLLMFAVRS